MFQKTRLEEYTRRRHMTSLLSRVQILSLFESCSSDGIKASRTDVRRALMRTEWFTSLNALKIVETLIRSMAEGKEFITKTKFLRVMETRLLRSNGTLKKKKFVAIPQIHVRVFFFSFFFFFFFFFFVVTIPQIHVYAQR